MSKQDFDRFLFHEPTAPRNETKIRQDFNWRKASDELGSKSILNGKGSIDGRRIYLRYS